MLTPGEACATLHCKHGISEHLVNGMSSFAFSEGGKAILFFNWELPGLSCVAALGAARTARC